MSHREEATAGAGYDANGMEREPFATQRTVAGSGDVGPRLWDPENPPEDHEPERTAHRQAMRDNPGCGPCRRGMGIVAPGPPHTPHTPGHQPHCSCEGCF